MLGRGLSSLIPPQKKPADAGQGAVPQQQPQADAFINNISQPAQFVPQKPVIDQSQFQQAYEPIAEAENIPDEIQPIINTEPQMDLPSAEPEPAPLLIEENPHHDEDPSPATLQVIDEKPSKTHEEIFENVKKSVVDETLKPHEFVYHIEVDKIHPNPHQPRKVFDEENIKELASSIREFGLLQPIVVTKVEKDVANGTEVEYELISGERRLKASKMLGLERIPAIIRNVNLERERLELAIIENLQRENLNPVEMGRALVRLQEEFRLTQREIAVRMGKSRESIANTMRLLDLPMEIQDALAKGRISESHGRLLLTIDDPGLQQKLFNDLMSNRMTTRELKEKVEAVKPVHHREKKAGDLPPELKMLQERLTSELGAPVSIHQSGDTGKITISYFSNEELKGILDKLAKGEEI